MTEKTEPGAAAPTPGEPRGPRALIVGLFLVAFGALFAWGSWSRDFWNPDEPRTALIARGIERGGDGLVPSFAGQPYLDQPPLVFWLAAAVREATGLDPRLSYRLPLVAAAVLGLGLTYLAGRRLFGGRIGFLAAAIEASTYFYFREASWLDDDLLFAVSCQLGITGFALATRKGAGPWHAPAGWIGLALAGLSKSALLAFAIVLPPLILFLFLEGGVHALRRGLARVLRARYLALFLAITVPWYAVAFARHGSALAGAHLLGQHLGRLWSSPWDAHPPYYYLVRVSVLFLPWTLLLPLGLLHGKDRLGRDGERLAFLWAVSSIVILSFISSKKPGYALFVWPPLALLVAAAVFESREWYSVWEDYLREGVLKVVPYLLRIPLLVVLAAAGIHAAGWWSTAAGPRLQAFLSNRAAFFTSLAIACISAGIAFFMSFRIQRLLARKAFPAAAFDLACAALILFLGKAFTDPAWNAFHSKRELLEEFAARIPAGAPVGLYGKKDPEVYYYLERPIEHLTYPDPALADDPNLARIEEHLRKDSFLIAMAEDFERLNLQFPSLAPLIEVRGEGEVGTEGKRLLLLASRRGP